MRAKVLLIISALLMIGAFADTTTVPPTSCQETKSRGWYWDGQKCERCVSTTIQPRFAVCTDANASTVILCYADEIQDTDKDG